MGSTHFLLASLILTACSHSSSNDAVATATADLAKTPTATTSSPRSTSPTATSEAPSTSPSPRPSGAARVAHTSASCAPWDGAAIDLVIDDRAECSTSPRALTAIAIWNGLPLTPGKVLRFRDGSKEGSGRKCPADGSRCVMATQVELVVDTYDDKTMAMTGYYTLTFRDGSTVSELFTATRCGGQAICG